MSYLGHSPIDCDGNIEIDIYLLGDWIEELYLFQPLKPYI